MAFGNGATSVDAAGKVIYKAPRVSEAYEKSATLYSRTFQKVISNNTTTDKIEVIPGTSYTDLKITCTLGYNEPSAQDTFDTSTTNDGLYVFDELALLSYAADPTDSTMLTHVIFHPVQKSANRTIEIPINHPSQIPICFFVVLLLHSMSFPLLITTITAPIFLNNLMHIPIPSR